MKSTLLNTYKNKTQTAIRRGLTAALAALIFAGCPGAESLLEFPQTNTGGNNPPLREGPPAEVRLKSINVYYSGDPAKKNLLNSFNNALGDFTVTDADINQSEYITVEAEAADEEASVSISWTYDAKTGKMSEPVTGTPAVLGEVSVPEKRESDQKDTQISILVVNGNKKYTTNIRLRAPGADASLMRLSVKLNAGSAGDAELLPDLGFSGDEAAIPFYASVYQYAVSLDDSNASLVITAQAASVDSEITLTQDGTLIQATKTAVVEEEPEPDPQTSILASENEEDLNPPEAAPAGYIYSWNITGGKAGANASKIVLTSVNKASGSEVSSKYTVMLVPPADPALADAHLSYLKLTYTGSGADAINFSPEDLSYTATVPSMETAVKLVQCTPRGKGIISIAYKTVSTAGAEKSPGTIDIMGLPSSEISLPAAGSGDKLVVTVAVALDDPYAGGSMVYTVEFTKPSYSLSYEGTIQVEGGSGYTLTGLSATTADGGSVSATLGDNDTWTVAIDQLKGAPVSFTATFTKTASGGTTTAHSVTCSPASPVTPGTPAALKFSLTSTDENPVYLLVQSAADLASMSAAENYFLANNIDLSTLNDGKWSGPTGYMGHFNGNGKTITLSLSKTDGDTGLFTTLASGAIIENLQVAVKTYGSGTVQNAALTMTKNSHFGAVVGMITDGDYIIRGVRVTGRLNYAGGSDYLLVGGLIGEVQNKKNATLLIENCESNIEMGGTVKATVKESTSNDNTMFGFGGLIGKSALDSGSVTIRNSRTSGTIIVTNETSFTHSSTTGGGLIGVEGQGKNNSENAAGAALVIENCYSTMEIVITSSWADNSNDRAASAGGLIGSLYNSKTESNIKNSVALNPKVIAVSKSTASGDFAFSGRVVGRNVTNNKAALSGNYALKTMLTGTSESGAVVNNADINGSSNDGTGEDFSFFQNAANWKNMGFTDANWDFTAVGANGYPALKFK
ncbi:MAG: hypothetical protein LBJ35_07745 [Spirochaetaceae bacterium]|jgi:hypothetical protein|nr:hypothetical protein [Spirochaetaceae bacterium]